VPPSPDPIRWGIVGTASIARAQFLPGLREAGGGRAASVASRDRARAEAYATAHGIDQGIEGYQALVESPGIVTFAAAHRLLLTCGFKRSYDTFTSVLGSEGQIQLTNPFHPSPADTLTIRRPNADPVAERPTTDQRSFTAAIRHIHAVLRGEEAAVHTAADCALPAARVLEELQQRIVI
jgi:predicted dehydrogenase